MVRAARSLPVSLALVAVIGLAGLVLGRIYADALLAQLVLGAAIGSVGVSAAARRAPSWLVAPVSVAALTGYTGLALTVAARRAELPGGLGEVFADAAGNGIPRLLTALIPVEPLPDTVLVPLVAAWLAGLAGAEVALRAGRTLLGFLPAILLYAGAVYVVGPNAEPAIWPTVAVVAALAAGLAAGRTNPAVPETGRTAPVGPAATGRATPGPDGPRAAAPEADRTTTPDDDADSRIRAALRLRSAAGTAAGLAVVIGLAAAIAPEVAARVDGTPVDPRRYVQPPQVDSLDENPLIRISGWALNPDQVLLDVRTTTASEGTDPAGADGDGGDPDGADGEPGGVAGPDGDGEADPLTGQADPADPADPAGSADGGTGDPVVDEAVAAGSRIRLAVLPDYDGVTWRVGATYRNAGRILPPTEPLPGATVQTVRQEITVVELSGRLLPAVPTPAEITGSRVAYDVDSGTIIRPEGLTAGLRYTVTSRRERPDFNLLATANVPAGDEVARVLRIEEGVPDPMRRLADQLAAENGAPYGRAVAIEEFLAEHYRVAPDAPSGHAYPNLAFFLFGPRNGGGQRGTSEHFAAAFAVLGRLTGLPTRVVVGFRAGTGPVRAADAVAWPEVLFEDLGWVAFDPLPRPDTVPRPVEEDFKPQPEEPPPPPDEATPSAGPTPSASAGPVAAPGGDGGASGVLLAGGGTTGLVLLLTGLGLAVLWLRRGLRRRRLADGPPDQRIAGAWREVTDALRLAGHPVPGNLAATEVAGHARSATAAELSIDDLAGLVNLAAFAPAQASPEQADRAGALAVAYADGLRADRPWWRRVLWSLHPGPLRWHR
nr:transglutaminaseTgpA domain-containing protein [Micromonospora sp. DSM 115978]